MKGTRLYLTIGASLAAAAVCLTLFGPGSEAPEGALDDGRARMRRILTRTAAAEVGVGVPQASLLEVRDVQDLDPTGAGRLTFEIGRPGVVPPVALLHLDPVADAKAGERVTPSFVLRPEASGDPYADAILDRLLVSVEHLDDGAVRNAAAVAGPLFGPPTQLWLILLALLLWFIGVMVVKGREVQADARFKNNHVLAFLLQVVFIGYWALHWQPVRFYLPMLMAQLAFAYAVDMLLSLSRLGRWTATFGPIPVVGSTSLFVWFVGGDAYLAFVAIFVALACKAFVQREGRHIFNPSAIGITIVAIPCILAPSAFGYVDISRELNLPPNMAELIFVFGFLAQRAVPVVLISVASYLAMAAMVLMGLTAELSPWWPAVFLALVLLATDPSTSPITGAGRILFGLFIGFGIALGDMALFAAGSSTFFAKVLPVPIANVLVPAFDRWGERLPARLRSLSDGAHNRAHMALWAALVVVSFFVVQPKVGAYIPDLHERYESPLYSEPLDAPTSPCSANPVFCDSFSFVEEARLLFSGGPEGEAGTGR